MKAPLFAVVFTLLMFNVDAFHFFNKTYYTRVTDTSDFTSGSLTFGALPAKPTYNSSNETYSNGIMGGIIKTADGLVNMMQLQPFPYELLMEISKGYSTSQTSSEIMQYEMGIIIGIVFGLLIFIGMIVFAIVFFVLRRRDQCGGAKRVIAHPQRRAYCITYSVFGTIFHILSLSFCMIAMVLALRSNSSLTSFKGDMITAINDVEALMNQTAEEFNYVFNESFGHLVYVTMDYDIDNFENVMGSRVRESMRTYIDAAFTVLFNVDPDIQYIVNTTIAWWEQINGQINGEFGNFKLAVNELSVQVRTTRLDSSCYCCDGSCCNATGCFNIDSDLIKVGCDLELLENITSQYNVLKTMRASPLISVSGANAKNIFETLHTYLKTRYATILSTIRSDLDVYANEVANSTDVIEETLRTWLPTADMKTYFEEGWSQLNSFVSASFALTVMMCVLQLMADIASIVAMILGWKEYDAETTATSRSALSDVAGKMIYILAIISSGFACVFIIVTALFFFYGVNMEKIVCEPSENMNFVQKYMDKPSVIPNITGVYLPYQLFKNGTLPLKLHDVYLGCINNSAMYNLWKLHYIHNLTAAVDYDLHIPDFGARFDDMYSNLSDVTFYTTELDTFIDNYLNNANLNWTAMHAQLYNDEYNFNVPSYENNFLNISNVAAASGGPLNPAKYRLPLHKEALYNISINEYTKWNPIKTSLQNTLTTFETRVNSTNTAILNAKARIQDAVEYMHNVSFDKISEYTNYSRTRFLNYLEMYEARVNLLLNDTIGQCEPFYRAYYAVNITFCDNHTDATNATWLSLGLLIIFLYWGVFFNIKLYKHFAIMDEEDPYDGGEGFDNPYAEAQEVYFKKVEVGKANWLGKLAPKKPRFAKESDLEKW